MERLVWFTSALNNSSSLKLSQRSYCHYIPSTSHELMCMLKGAEWIILRVVFISLALTKTFIFVMKMSDEDAAQ